jgi:hypothetical protein
MVNRRVVGVTGENPGEALTVTHQGCRPECYDSTGSFLSFVFVSWSTLS